MRNIRKILAVLLIINMVIGLIPNFWLRSYAVPLPLNIIVNSYSGGTAEIRWDNLAGTQSVVVSYHTPPNNFLTTTTNQVTNIKTISGLQDDIIYDIKVEVYDAAAAGGSKIGEGLIYFLPRISFYSNKIERGRQAVSGGGYESGTEPRLNLKWAMPKVWNAGAFVYANDPAVLGNMAASVDNIYQDGRQVSSFNFRVNISTNLSTLNSGSTQSAILIDYGNPEYSAKVSGNLGVTAGVHAVDGSGFMNFDLIGRKDLNTALPAAEAYGLPDGDVLPGVVFYMNIKPVFKNAGGNNVSLVTVGPNSAQNGSMLTGLTPYTYTPIRFMLTKDDLNNVYVKVYRINQGSLDLPGLYYEVQTSDDPAIIGDWAVKKTMTDSFFPNNSEYAVTVVTGMNPNNQVYYKIVVKTDSSSDRIESEKMPYTLIEDISKPPVPTGVTVIDMDLVTGQALNPKTNQQEDEKSTNVTISWTKPANWDQIKANNPYDPAKDIYFHFLINTYQTELTLDNNPELEANGKQYGAYPIKFRLVKYVSALSPNIRENGNYLEYTVKGFELFKGEDSDGAADNAIPNAENYPAFLLSNKVYYMQMYTTNGINKGSTALDKISDKSLTVSFTTLAGGEREVPLPKNLRLNKNEIEVIPNPEPTLSNYVEIEFDKVSVDWRNYMPDPSLSKAIYYDLYMSNSTATDSFKLIGTTQNLNADITFIGTDPQSVSIKATMRDFSPATDAYTAFGPKLTPNTTYYIMVKTRLVMQDQADRESVFTSILPVTTVSGDIKPPDESSRKPLAPTDFAVAKDGSGNPILSGSFVTLSWLKKENNVKYEIICTTAKVDPNAILSTYSSDPFYTSFKATFGSLSLDPSADPLAENFEYNNVSKVCQYSIIKWLFPNKLYYFSVRAVNKTNGNTSSWVSIPVTTMLIDSPEGMEAIQDAELGFFWMDASPNLQAEDFKIYVKGPKDRDFKLLSRAEAIVTKDGTVYYARLINLEPNTPYDVRVYKGNITMVLVYEDTNKETKDSYHQVEVKWRGLPSYKYELAIKSADQTDYTVLTVADLEEYEEIDGKRNPYYIEETAETASTNHKYFYARIKSSLVPVPGGNGTVERQLLRPNTKYFIKVRAVKIDPLDTTLVSFSKYIGPVSLRTEFSQDDYDVTDRDVKKKAVFKDKINKFEEKLYWRMAVGNGINNKVLLKEEKVLNAIQNNGRYPLTLDISELGRNVNTDVIYIPYNVVSMLNNENKSLTVKINAAEYTLRPRTLDIENMEEIAYLKGNPTVKDVLLKVTVIRNDNVSGSLPAKTKLSSKNNDFKILAVGSVKTNEELKKQFYDKVYNEETGIVQEKLNILLNNNKGTGSSSEIEQYVTELVGEMESDLSYYINDTVEGKGTAPGIIVNTKQVQTFSEPLVTRLLHYDETGLKMPYVIYDGESAWRKISQNIFYTGNSVTFVTEKTGKYLVLAMIPATGDVQADHWSKDYISTLISKYDLSDVFSSNKSFYPDSNVTVKEAILLYEKIMEKTNENIGLDIKQKAKKLGLDNVVDMVSVVNDISRQQAATVTIRVYCLKMGVNIDSLQPKRSLYIKDEIDIDGKFYKYCIEALDLGVFTLDERKAFLPQAPITRAEMVAAFVKLLKLTGDLE
ncbi:MAG: S-layer homology domain-containing protein [Clostridia bacterium]|nr:S-layer homology domain-containing protein [Clostridia bacterium]